MRGNRSVGRNGVTVLRVQLRADVGVQREIQRPQLLPQAIELLREVLGRHVVSRLPHDTGVGEAKFLRALVGDLDEPHVVLLEWRGDRVPAFPHFAQAGRVAILGEDLGDRLDIETRRCTDPRLAGSTCHGRTRRPSTSPAVASSAASFGSDGDAIVSVFLSTVSLRCCSGEAFCALKVAARLAKSVTALLNASVARAEIASVSGVMYVACVQPAWLASLLKRRSVVSALSRKVLRSVSGALPVGATCRHATNAASRRTVATIRKLIRMIAIIWRSSESRAR